MRSTEYAAGTQTSGQQPAELGSCESVHALGKLYWSCLSKTARFVRSYMRTHLADVGRSLPPWVQRCLVHTQGSTTVISECMHAAFPPPSLCLSSPLCSGLPHLDQIFIHFVHEMLLCLACALVAGQADNQIGHEDFDAVSFCFRKNVPPRLKADVEEEGSRQEYKRVRQRKWYCGRL